MATAEKTSQEAPGSGPGQGRAAACSRVRRGQPDAGARGDGRAGRQGRLAGELLGHRDHRARRDRHGDGDRGHEVGQQRRRAAGPDLQRPRRRRGADARPGSEPSPRRCTTYDLFQSSASWASLPERFRRHAVATRHAAENLAGPRRRPGPRRARDRGPAPRRRPARPDPALPGLRGDSRRPHD